MKLLNPKLDFVFKKLLAGDTGILTDLLNSVLKLPKTRRIGSVTVKNPIILPEEITQKYIVLDILATDKSGKNYEIEMQIRSYESYPKRALFYLSRIYAGQLDAGEDYEKLKPVIGIHFLDYEMFADTKDFYFRFAMRDVRYPELRLTEDMTLHIVELPKFERIRKTGQKKGGLGEWLHFFNHAHEEDKTMRTAYKNPAIHKAFDALENLSADETVRHLARVREDALRNERSELFYAEKRGEKRGEYIGKINLVQQLLKHPVTPKKVLTGKSLKDLGIILKQLEAELKKKV
ncbi:Putative transposase, RpnA-like [Desulfonema limicola]|uniref:Transposase, RpnA-like n=1 Tax=Desulfonema limicola TaxID=45656 RepID=A0A975GE94_9BACT|nr:Rpn family recombination-promoting nuclease/putative transposase [Desulfonema limicola]QTA77968.1 Putative transposase, RpnA-like [Desulfonema limicola]